MTENEYVIETRGLTRYFGAHCAVQELDLRVPRGSVFGFLGRNGSGKSTTIRMLLGLLAPTRGEGTILGHDIQAIPAELRARIGYMPEGHPLPGWMKVAQCVDFQASFYSHWNETLCHTLIDHFRLRKDQRVGELSRGQRAGLAMALTMAPEPDLLVLDDPALGLDPVARRLLLEVMVYVTQTRERTILFSSHLLADVERVANWIAVLDYSVLRAQCPLEEFQRRLRQFVLHFSQEPPQAPVIPGSVQILRSTRELRVTLVEGDRDTSIPVYLEALGADRIEELPLSLEDAFIDYLWERGERQLLLANLETRS